MFSQADVDDMGRAVGAAILFVVLAVALLGAFAGYGAGRLIPGITAPARPTDPPRPPGDPDDYILVQTIEGGFVWMKIK